MQIKNNPALNFILIIITTLIVGILIGCYCDIFYALDLLAKDRLIQNPASTFIITPLLFWISAYLCRKFSPNSSGSSLDHVKSALNQSKKYPQNLQKIATFLSFRIAIFSAISSLISSFGGGALGREGPAMHISTSIFAAVAYKLKNKIPQIDLQSWIFAGSAVADPIIGIFVQIAARIRPFKQSP